MTPATALDNALSLETPEGIRLNLKPAGLLPRAQATFIDFFIKIILEIVLALILSFTFQLGAPFMLLGLFLINWFYEVFFEVLRDGQTPGKKTLGIRVLLENGAPINWQASILRNLLRVADFLPLFYLGGLMSMAFSPGFKRLGDWAAGTLVVYTQSKQQLKEAQAAELKEKLPLPEYLKSFPLNQEEQRAMRSFQDRETELSEERKEELLKILKIP